MISPEFMSLAYQLEILCYQAERMRTLGWAEYLAVEMTSTRKSFKVSYWMYVMFAFPLIQIP